MKEIIHIDNSEMTAEYKEALKTHQRIMANGEICAQTLLEICKDLKKMRDEKLYEEFGYQSFDEYCEKMAGIKSRMAYNYISTYERLGSTVLQSNANLGITKLELIAGMNPVERAEILEDGAAENMSVSEIKELVRKTKEQGEQISLLENQIAELKEETAETEYDAEADELRDKVKNLTEELLKKESAYKNDLEKVKKETAEAVRAEIQQDGQGSISEKVNAEVKKQLDKAVKNAKKEAAKEVEERLKAQTEKQESKIKDLEAALTSAGTEKEKLEKKLALSDTNSAKAMVYIEAIQDNFNSLFSLIGGMPDEQGNRFKGAVLKLIGVMKQKAEE